MLIRQTVLYLPAQLLGPLAQLVGIVLWTHWLNPDQFGVFTLAMAAQEAVYLFLLSFWSYFLLRFLPGADAERRARIDTLEIWILSANVVLQAIVILIALRCMNGQWPAPSLLAVLIFYTLSRSYCTHLAERARVNGAIGTYTLLQTLGPAGGLLIGWSWTSVAVVGPVQVLAAYAMAQTLSLIVALHNLKLRGGRKTADDHTLAQAFRYGLPLAASGLLAWVPGNGIRFVIESGLGIAAVGLFSVGWTLGQRACSFAAMLVTAAAFPLALRLDATGGRAKALEQLSLNGALLCAALLPTAAGLILLAPVLTQAAVSKPYVATTLSVLPIAVLAGLIKNLRSHFANQPFLLAEKSVWTLALDALETVLFLAGAAIGIHMLGLVGAAWGALAAVTVGAVLAFAIAVRKLKMPLPGAHLLRIALATLIMSAVLYALPPLSGWYQLAAAVALGAAVYLAVLALNYRGHLGRLRTALQNPNP